MKYDREYALRWIRYFESRKDLFKPKHLNPYLKQVFAGAKTGEKILDVGCGWGEALASIPTELEYFGCDPSITFLNYIAKNNPDRTLHLRRGGLPSQIPFEGQFDNVLCSMVLHCVGDLETSIDTLFSKAIPHRRVVIVDFRDKAHRLVRAGFIEMFEERKDYVRGLYALSDEVQLEAEAHLHAERKIESLLRRYGRFKKTFLGPFFVGYSAIKDK